MGFSFNSFGWLNRPDGGLPPTRLESGRNITGDSAVELRLSDVAALWRPGCGFRNGNASGGDFRGGKTGVARLLRRSRRPECRYHPSLPSPLTVPSAIGWPAIAVSCCGQNTGVLIRDELGRRSFSLVSPAELRAAESKNTRANSCCNGCARAHHARIRVRSCCVASAVDKSADNILIRRADSPKSLTEDCHRPTGYCG